MNSLVGYGVSSESDSDAEERGKDASEEASPPRMSRNFLLESNSASSESDGEAEPEEPPASLRRSSASQQHGLPAPFQGMAQQNKLPPPALHTSSGSSVFANPFKAQAEQKLSALQKHVPLTMQAKPSQIGGKRMCVSYRKDGRCRFGIKCKFAHDSDLQSASEGHSSLSGEAPAQEASSVVGSRGAKVDAQQAKKRKSGLSNTLIPPKRAMKQFAMQRDRERLNMS